MKDSEAERQAGGRPSLRDVAARAGVSAGCASNVLNFRRRRDDPIGRAVLLAAEELGYRANAMAANLRRSTSRLVGVVLPDFENPFFGALLSALEREARASGYRLTAASSHDDPEVEAREVGALLDWRVAGLLVAPTLRTLPDGFAGTGVPLVVVDRVSGSAAADEVSADNESAAREVMERLIALGHRDVLLALSDLRVLNMSERFRGVLAAIAAADADMRLEPIVCGWTVESAQRAFEAYLARGELPTAVFALSNLAALAAYGAMGRRGLRPGRDLALVSFDDAAWMAHMHPPVAAVEQPVEEIGRLAWARLLARIGGEEGPARGERVACRLHERGTMIPA